MSDEILKRVLLAIKDQARGMRKDKLERRINPKPAVVAEKVELEPADEQEAPFTGDEADDVVAIAADPEKPPEKSDEDDELKEIRALLARS